MAPKSDSGPLQTAVLAAALRPGSVAHCDGHDGDVTFLLWWAASACATGGGVCPSDQSWQAIHSRAAALSKADAGNAHAGGKLPTCDQLPSLKMVYCTLHTRAREELQLKDRAQRQLLSHCSSAMGSEVCCLACIDLPHLWYHIMYTFTLSMDSHKMHPLQGPGSAGVYCSRASIIHGDGNWTFSRRRYEAAYILHCVTQLRAREHMSKGDHRAPL